MLKALLQLLRNTKMRGDPLEIFTLHSSSYLAHSRKCHKPAHQQVSAGSTELHYQENSVDRILN